MRTELYEARRKNEEMRTYDPEEPIEFEKCKVFIDANLASAGWTIGEIEPIREYAIRTAT